MTGEGLGKAETAPAPGRRGCEQRMGSPRAQLGTEPMPKVIDKRLVTETDLRTSCLQVTGPTGMWRKIHIPMGAAPDVMRMVLQASERTLTRHTRRNAEHLEMPLQSIQVIGRIGSAEMVRASPTNHMVDQRRSMDLARMRRLVNAWLLVMMKGGTRTGLERRSVGHLARRRQKHCRPHRLLLEMIVMTRRRDPTELVSRTCQATDGAKQPQARRSSGTVGTVLPTASG